MTRADEISPAAAPKPAKRGEATPRRPRPRKEPRRRTRKVTIALTVIALVAAGGYTAAAASAELPDPELVLAAEELAPVVADGAPAQAAVDAQPLPTAIGWAESEDVWTNDDVAYPLASISKLITVLVALESRPLAPGTDGETIVWTDADVALQAEYLALDGVAYPIPAGTEVTERQMLTLIFLPSANDFAAAYARSVFGTDEAFLAAVAAWAADNGLDSLEFVEPTGMDEGNKANAADLVRLARIALQHPTVTQFTNLESAEMPWGIGTIENTNPLLGELPGMVGLKTGRSGSAGFNLLAAQRVDAHGRDITKISVTLGRGSIEERAQSGREMLAAMDPLPQLVPLISAGTAVGEAVSATGQRESLETAAAASAVLLPGEAATFEATLGTTATSAPDQADAPSAGGAGGIESADGPDAGPVVGSVKVSSPTGSETVPVVQLGSFTEPDLWWRVTHPASLWG